MFNDNMVNLDDIDNVWDSKHGFCSMDVFGRDSKCTHHFRGKVFTLFKIRIIGCMKTSKSTTTSGAGGHTILF